MFKIWIKTMADDKITRSYMYKSEDKFDLHKLRDYLMEICHELDIPTPVILKSHIKNFDLYNITRFKTSDFVESVDFDLLVLENATEA